MEKYLEPLVITKGGIYSGNFLNVDSDIDAITINTTEPVIIENTLTLSAGNHIRCAVKGANVTVRNSVGVGLAPTKDGVTTGRYITMNNFANVVIENNELVHTAGIYLLDYLGNRTLNNTIKVRFNKSKNIDGRDRYGNFVPAKKVQFIQLNKCIDVPGIDLGWNESVNEYGNSLVEDVINIYVSSGTIDSPLRVHNNLIDGAYPLPSVPIVDGFTQYSGGGIMIDGTYDLTTLKAPANIEIFDNHVIRTINYGIGIAGGNNNKVYNNRIVSTNIGPSGEKFVTKGNNGIQIWNFKVAPSTVFYNNTSYNNKIGYMNQLEVPIRKDSWFGSVTDPTTGAKMSACFDCTGKNIAITGPITKETEDESILLWNKAVKDQNITVGLPPKFSKEEVEAFKRESYNIGFKEGEEIGIPKGQDSIISGVGSFLKSLSKVA